MSSGVGITPAELMVIWLAAALAFAVWAFAGTLPEQARAFLAFLVLLATLAVALHRCLG